MQATDLVKPILKRKKLPDIRPGDTVRVFERIKEGGKARTAIFEGVVIARRHGSEPGATITVRKISFGVGVERVFPLYAPTIEKFEIMRRAKVRRAKLHYLRKRVGRRATLRGELMPPEIGSAEPEEVSAAVPVPEDQSMETSAAAEEGASEEK
ncbi:MAG: 50S ribosomal protein L19 [Candidatus Terrybacteria bacterium RIFCSPLOWO2_01_FULL_58_14]|uniref:Large ribosomal subunit protein bL19 n=2 Tax=Candidatus Terryibacteriota TaxID=1817920 RepID=A0A1G2PY83_9BACT|nr:MAG: 50S ribosomal protein L19 [Candidatus Terrybacteria bacterium RIFCSPHIGHO2_01_FULL_58_15]OHA53276.1 MAG: 50S ribosomal protein L19 [Candidatus Terrybacteria bacterium RIFCSPLOWO2_01_FULL_58_14]